MKEKQYKSLLERLKRLRAEYERDPTANTPPAVELLQTMIRNASSDQEIITLMSCLASEYQWYGLEEQEEKVMRDMTELYSAEPTPWISLAGYLTHVKQDLTEAKAVIEIGIRKALEKGHFIRHAYNTRARIAKRMQDYALLEKTLEKLIEYSPNPGRQDIGYEDDFLIDLPEGAIKQTILESYRETADGQKKK